LLFAVCYWLFASLNRAFKFEAMRI